MNTYAYVEGSPINKVDPTSLWSTDGPASPAISTIICDGKGGIEVQIRPMSKDELSCGIDECTREHESAHQRDASKANPNICLGKPKGTQIVMTNAEQKISEYVAYGKTINCYKRKQEKPKEKCEGSSQCQDIYKRNQKYYEGVQRAYK